MAAMLDVSLAARGTCPRYTRTCEALRTYLLFGGDFSGLRVEEAQKIANGFHSEDRFGQTRCLAPRERAHGRTFERHFTPD